MSYYIGKYGHIMEVVGGQPNKKEPPADLSSLEIENNFEEKDRALYFRDNIQQYHPEIFVKEKLPKATSRNKPMTQEDFREQMRMCVSDHIEEFWGHLSKLKDKDYVDGWLKAAAFGFSRAPTEREMDEEEKQKQVMKENKRKQDLIRRGIKTEDMED